MVSRATRQGVILFVLLLMVVFLAGCMAEKRPSSSSQVSSAQKEYRAISVVEKMRHDAVSSKVGRWAVVIGISDYKYDTRWDRRKGIPDLQYAHRDARAFARFLMSPQGGAFPADHVLLLTDRQATSSEVRNAIGGFLARSLENDLVIIFFAGHGVPDPDNPENLYLVCYDTVPGKYYGTAFPMWGIDDALQRAIHSKRVFVIADACHSAGVGGARGGDVSKKFNAYMERLAASREGVTKITASRADELSLEKDHLGGGHGVFTYYLLEALKGRGDHNGDGFVTMAEAYDYLYDRVRSETRHSQKPWASGYVSSDIPLGIVDQSTLARVKARADAQKAPSRPALYRPTPAAVKLPDDSNIALKLARAKLAKDEPGTALQMAEGVIARNDASKPDALTLKIEILLKDGDLKSAEDTEDLLVIPYPQHPAAAKGARLVYEYYLKESDRASPAEEIRQLEAYLKRHPGGLMEKEGKKKLEDTRAGIRTGYDKRFRENLTLAQGFIRQNRFDRAREELGRADALASEALSGFGISLDTGKVAALRLDAETRERRHGYEKAYAQAKEDASTKPLEKKIVIWHEFVASNPGNPHLTEARKTLSGLRKQKAGEMDRNFRTHFSRAKDLLMAGDYTAGYRSLDAGREYATSAQMTEIDALARRYNAPPEVSIVLDKSAVDWDTPVTFRYTSKDKEGDTVRVVKWAFGDGTSSTGDLPQHTYAKWSGPDKERRYRVTLKATDGQSTVTARKAITVKKQDRIKTFTVKGVSFKMVPYPRG